MKIHYTNNAYGLIACNRSGRSGQSKGIVTGLRMREFLTQFPLEDMCKTCLKQALADYKRKFGKDYTFKNNPYVETITGK